MYGKDSGSVTRAALVDNNGILYAKSSIADAALQGRLFSVSNQAKVATTAALATTWTGLGICNPSTSSKNAIVHEFGYALQIASDAAGVVGLMTSDTTGFADALVASKQAAMYGAGSPVVIADDGATIATPILVRALAQYGTEDTATSMFPLAPQTYQLNGSIVLPPGRSLMSFTTTATTACFVFHFVWEEVDA